MPRLSLRRGGVAAAAVLATAVVVVPQASAASERDAELTASVREALETANAPGAIVGVWQQGRAPYVKAFGVRNTTTKRPMRTGFFSRIGSVTKTFTVTALLQLADQGKVSLDDPIGKYVPGVISGDTITLRQLTNMTSGIPNYTLAPAFNAALIADPFKTWTTQELLGLAIGGPLDFAPGTGFTYSNTNTILIGQVVEQVSGQPIGSYIEDHIVKPLGLTGTSYPEGTTFPRPHADGYGNDTGKVENVTAWNPTWTGAAGQMVSTLRDMRIWAQRLSSGRGLYSAAMARERAASLAGSSPIIYGIGMFNVQQWRGHNGSLPGYQTLALYRPQSKTTVVAFINTDIEVKAKAPSTLVGEAITSVLTPKHVYDLPAAPGGDDE